MKRTKVLFYLPVLGTGGVERVVQYLASGLADRYDLVIAGQGADMENHMLRQAKLPPGVVLLEAPLGKASMKHRAVLQNVDKLLRIIAEHQPDVIMTAWPRVHLTTGIALSRLPAGKRPKWVLAEHNEIQNYLGTGIIARLKAIALRHFCAKADVYLAVSEKVAKLSAEVYGHPFRVIYNPAVNPEIERRSLEPVDHPWFQGDTPTVLSVGRMQEMKDFPTLVRAFKRVSEKMPAARLAILGEGELRGQLEALVAELGLGDKVWLPGFDPNPYKYMRRATVFTMSSAFGEASPLVLSEAMFLGKPVVLTSFATAPEFIHSGQDGLLVRVGDPEDLAKGLLEILQTPELRGRLGQQARAKVKERFSIERAVANYDKLFAGLLPLRAEERARRTEERGGEKLSGVSPQPKVETKS
ncbi:MAG: glycosyltransferase [Meiothermus sp.]|nr:glycosyltransferase [Meiothermus sp.]